MIPLPVPKSDSNDVQRRPEGGRSWRHGGTVAIGLATLAACAWVRSFRNWYYLGVCQSLGCDFRTYHAQAQNLLSSKLVFDPYWLYPPMAVVMFAPFGWLHEHPARWIWMVLNAGLGALLALWCAERFPSLGRLSRYCAAFALCALSWPLIDCFKWGQISLLIAVLSIVALRRSRPGILGFATAIKVYPAGFLIANVIQSRWRFVLATCAAATAWGLLVPIVVIGPTRTLAFTRRTLAVVTGAERTFTFGRTIAWWGGQGIGPTLVRWFRDGSHFGCGDRTTPLLFSLPGPLLSIATLSATIGILGATYQRMRNRSPTDDRTIALCLTAISLITQPAWHHYFVFLPFAAAVVLGDSQSSPLARRFTLASCAITAIPILLLKDVPQAGYRFSQWGGTTIATLLIWIALLLEPYPPPSDVTPLRSLRQP